MAPTDVVTKVDIPELKKLGSGKVREIYEIDAETLLFVTTDRISAYDVIMENGIPSKGHLLTALSNFWFTYLPTHLPHLKTHLSFHAFPSSLSPVLRTRSMLVRRYPLIKLESIVRGYLTGSAWAEYKRSGTVHGVTLPAELRESQKFPEPIWTPSTKAEQGEHDENISRERAAEIVGVAVAAEVERVSLEVYRVAAEYAATRGILIADTKFEFGLDPSSTHDKPVVVLIDEVLTPDSSRFWPADGYEVGKAQSSYDKQYLRDYLTSSGLKGKEGVRVPEEVVRDTAAKYVGAYERLTGEKFEG